MRRLLCWLVDTLAKSLLTLTLTLTHHCAITKESGHLNVKLDVESLKLMMNHSHMSWCIFGKIWYLLQNQGCSTFDKYTVRIDKRPRSNTYHDLLMHLCLFLQALSVLPSPALFLLFLEGKKLFFTAACPTASAISEQPKPSTASQSGQHSHPTCTHALKTTLTCIDEQ